MWKLKSQPYDVPVVLPPEGWPPMVTFDDITDPTTVRQVNPDDLAASFGSGVSLNSLTLELTKSPVTEGKVIGILNWLGEYPEPSLIPGDGRSKNIPFGMTIYHGNFIRSKL